jgi:hypothetical protein
MFLSLKFKISYTVISTTRLSRRNLVRNISSFVSVAEQPTSSLAMLRFLDHTQLDPTHAVLLL